jgi:hypothetical protein
MPIFAAAALPYTLSAIGAGASAGAGIYGAKKAGAAAKRAANVEQQSNQQAFELERQRLDEERRQWEAQQNLNRAQFDAAENERLFGQQETLAGRRLLEAREARRIPYHQAGLEAIGRIRDLTGASDQFAWRSPSNVGRPGPSGGRIKDYVV